MVDPLPGFDGRLEGTAEIVPDIMLDQQSQYTGKVKQDDPDWVTNRPA
jgi:hypothetical protein